MKRAFLSLYLLIVLATLGLGWALDQLWNAYQPDEPRPTAGASLAQMLELATAQHSDETSRELVHSIAERGLADVRLVPLSEISGERIVTRLQAGEPIAFEDSAGSLYHYRKLPDSELVLIVSEPQSDEGQQMVEALLAALFYLALAGVVFFWLWPLTRDLTKLERHAQALGRNPEYPEVEVSGRSAAQRLARAFNHMARRIQDLLRSQREMTHAVSHELRTPLARMKFALEMADVARDPENLKRKLDGLRADVDEMDQLVNQLLHYARFEHQLELQPSTGDMPALIRNLSERLRAHLPEAPHIQLSIERIDPAFRCDWHLMERALHNLLQNALRYAEHRIDVVLYCDSRICRIQVSDDGPGISPEDRERIFQSFVRLRDAPDRHSAGFGLGLAIVQRVMQWHQGEVTLSPAAKGGACFTLEWPRDATQSAPDGPQAPPR